VPSQKKVVSLQIKNTLFMKSLLTNLALFFALVGYVPTQAQTIDIYTNDVQLTLVVGQNNKVYQAYFGKKLNEIGRNVFSQKRHEAYIAWGTYDLFEPALRVTHPDGNPALAPHYVSHKSTRDANGNILTEIVMRDSVYPVTVTLFYMAYPKENVIRAWTEIIHTQRNPIILHNFASNMLHFDANRYWLTQFHGDWAAEMHQKSSVLTAGIKVLDSRLGQRTAMFQTPVFMLSPNDLATETSGEVLLGTLEWSGNFQFLFEIDNYNSLRVISGMNPFASEYHLPRNVAFTTPAFIFT